MAWLPLAGQAGTDLVLVQRAGTPVDCLPRPGKPGCSPTPSR
jgi:hypothetical protein